MNPFALFTGYVRKIVESLANMEAINGTGDLSRIVVEPPRDQSHGDLATNAAMVLSKDVGKKPRELALLIAQKLLEFPQVNKAEVAGPGFINISLAPEFWLDVLRTVLKVGKNYGRGDLGKSELVNVEYVSVNPTGPMHVGHGRGAVFGDALANLLVFTGHKVTREYYVNDAGAQVDVLARSAYIRYREALGETISVIPDGLYPGEYLQPVGRLLANQYGASFLTKPENEWLPLFRSVAVDAMLDMIKEDLAALAIRHEFFFSERSLSAEKKDEVAVTIEVLRRAGHVYEGRLPPPKGQLPEDWEDREQTLFRSTKFGDDVDRPLKKSDGSYTYFASDIAYHRDKIERGFKTLIDIWGADHGGYVKRMQAAVAALSENTVKLDVKLCQLVRLFRDGEPVKMSKRAGDFVTLREVVDEVGSDAVRFMMLFRKNDAPLDFDLAKVIEHSRENPVFYVQYAHARAKSVFRNAREAMKGVELGLDTFLTAPIERLTDPGELSLIKRVAQWPRVVEAAAGTHEPHRIAFFLHELASEFHSQWNRGTEMPHLRFIMADDPSLTIARLTLVYGIKLVLVSGLAILGVGAPEEMR
jgi:arginyl-tRNA synthetase